MELNFSFDLISVSCVSGVSSLCILVCKFLMQRSSFFKYIEYQPDLLLLIILCRAEKEGDIFIRTGKDIALIGHTQNNQWIKPYQCLPNVFSRSSFLNKDEVYTYKIDFCLLWIIRINRYLKNEKNIASN